MIMFTIDETKTNSNTIVLKNDKNNTDYERMKNNIRFCSSVCNIVFKK